jgi:UDP-2-acetamido-2,6-beta-L-arabino-hexul-4-ose reductase
MKILITGAKGFVGKNLIAELRNQGYTDLLEYDIDSASDVLDEYARECEFVFHLAGVNRPAKQEDFMTGNFGFTSVLLESLKKYNNKAPVLITSSTQASLDNPYGQSKKAGEDLLFQYGKENDVKVFVYRLPNVFGKWSRPNYNSAVATFCNNIANDLPIQVNDPNVEMNLVYIDDVISSFIGKLQITDYRLHVEEFETATPVHRIKLREIVELLHQFKESRSTLQVPDMNDAFTKKLYSTYLSYLPKDKFSYPLKMNTDDRGSFTEFLKSPDRGQVSVNIFKPHTTKGNHWHHTKNEKFLVVSGTGVIRFRKIDTEEIVEYFVSDEKLEVVDIPVGYTHNIENLGDTDMVTIMWVNEIFDKEKPDTFFLEV